MARRIRSPAILAIEPPRRHGADHTEELALRQRWREVRSQQSRGGTITKYHPQERIWKDVRD
jgi:hypothetical protein